MLAFILVLTMRISWAGIVMADLDEASVDASSRRLKRPSKEPTIGPAQSRVRATNKPTFNKPKDGTPNKPKDGTSNKPKDGPSNNPKDGTSNNPKDGTSNKPKDETPNNPKDGTSNKPKDRAPSKPKDGA